MSRLQGLVARLRSILRPDDAEGRMEEEFRFHLDMEQARLVRQGLPPDAARRQALLTFGGVDAHRETMRDERGARWLDDLGADLRYALRAMRRSPGYALAVALTLGVGIGVNGMVVGYVNALLFRPIPARDPDQLVALFANLPAAADAFSQRVPFLSVPVSELVKGSSIGGLLAGALSWGKAVAGSIATLVLIVIAGVYIAINPEVYRNGLIKLFPKRVQPQVSDTLNDAGAALRLWLGAQLIAMILVGVLIGAGLAVIGVPSALGLGFVAGVLEFIPYLGPILSAIPALLIASTQSWEMVGWTLLLFLIVQQVENNIILPLITGRAVDLPPAVGLLAVVAIGILFGPLGLLLAYPLAIVIDVAVRRLYVREMLGEKVDVPGEKTKRA